MAEILPPIILFMFATYHIYQKTKKPLLAIAAGSFATAFAFGSYIIVDHFFP